MHRQTFNTKLTSTLLGVPSHVLLSFFQHFLPKTHGLDDQAGIEKRSGHVCKKKPPVFCEPPFPPLSSYTEVAPHAQDTKKNPGRISFFVVGL